MAKDDYWLENKLDIIACFHFVKICQNKEVKESRNPVWNTFDHLESIAFNFEEKNISPVSQSLVIKYLRETLRWEISYFLKVEMQLERIKLVPLFIFSAKNKLSKNVSSLL